jgi:quercetin dioxygenase-like cupin family protein
MTIQNILDQLEDSDTPVAKSFHTEDKFKVLIFGFKKGMKLKDHKAHHPTKLLVISGDIMYHQNNRETRLKKYDEIDIPAEVSHSVGAIDDSLVLLTQGE